MFLRLLDKTSAALLVLGACAAGLMVLHIIVDVTGRYVFGAPLPGTVEIVARFYMIALAFMPLAYVQKRDEHFVATMFTDFLPARTKSALEGAISLVMCAVGILLAWATAEAAQHATATNEQVQAAAFILYTWPTRWVVPFGIILMAAYALLNGIAKLSAARDRG